MSIYVFVGFVLVLYKLLYVSISLCVCVYKFYSVLYVFMCFKKEILKGMYIVLNSF